MDIVRRMLDVELRVERRERVGGGDSCLDALGVVTSSDSVTAVLMRVSCSDDRGVAAVSAAFGACERAAAAGDAAGGGMKAALLGTGVCWFSGNDVVW